MKPCAYVVVGAAGLATLAGCFFDDSGLTGGFPDGGADTGPRAGGDASESDAAAPSISDAAAPSISDAAAPSISDAAAPSISDAATDAATDSAVTDSGDAGGPCRDILFDSFDDGTLGTKWDSFDQVGAILELDGKDLTSPPKSLRATLLGDAGYVSATLKKSFAPVKHFCTELAIRGGAQAKALAIVGMNGQYVISLETGPSSFAVTELYAPSVGGGFNVTAGQFSASTEWRRVVLDAAFPAGAGKGTISVTLNGSPALKSPIGGTTLDLTLSALKVGIAYASPQATGTIHFDDVGYAFPL